MIYEMEDLEKIAHSVIDLPWGLGDRILAANPESWAPYLRFLSKVVRTYQPQVCLELGVYMGTATAHMALASYSTLVIGVDRDFHPDAEGNLERFDNVVLIEGDTTEVTTQHKVADALPFNRLNKERIGLIFIDSTHDGDTPRREYERYSPMFDRECLIVCDDLLGPEHLKIKMQAFWQWLPGEKKEMHYLHPTPSPKSGIDEPGFGISIFRR